MHPAFGMFLARALAALADELGSPKPPPHHRGGRRRRNARPPDPGRAGRIRTRPSRSSAGARAALRRDRGGRGRRRLTAPSTWCSPTSSSTTSRSDWSRDGQEVLIGLDGDTLVEHRRRARSRARRAARRHRHNRGRRRARRHPALHRRARRGRSTRGYALLIDYGDESGAGEPHGYREHRTVEDVLAAPGAVDITAGVDFWWVADHARTAACNAFPLVQPDRRAARARLRAVAARRARDANRNSSPAARGSRPSAPGRCDPARRCWWTPARSAGCAGCCSPPRASGSRRGWRRAGTERPIDRFRRAPG